MFGDGTLIICLGINLLLCGLIMYYCKQKFNSYDHKLQSMMELISALTELTEEEMAKEPPVQNLNPINTNETNISKDIYTTETNTDTYSNDSNINNPNMNASNIKSTSINLNDFGSYTPNPYKDLHNLVNISENFNQSDDSLSDSDSDSDSDDSNDNDNNDDDKIELNTVELNIENNKMTNSPEITAQPETKVVALEEDKSEDKDIINYDRLTVLELRNIVKNKKLSTHPTRLKRNELLNLLQ